tara:strand:- start:567 stop:1136 length:570 start_codon:yes stop_codon:yes gene_type:complete
MSAREVFIVGSIDERVKAIITMMLGFGDNSPKEDHDSELFSFARKTVLSKRIKDLPHTYSEQIPIVSHDQLGTPSALSEITAYRWFIEYGGRYGTNWKNVVSFSNTEVPDLFHVGQCASHLNAPILMIVAEDDEMEDANSQVSYEIFETIQQPKELVLIDGGHFGLLHYPSTLFNKSSKAQIKFLKNYL